MNDRFAPSLGLFFALAGAVACQSTGPTAPPSALPPVPSSSTSTAGAAPTASFRSTFVASCAQTIRTPNVARYAERAKASGLGAEAATAEAEFAMAKAFPLMEDVCACLVAEVPDADLASGAFDVAAVTGARMPQCLPLLTDRVKSVMPSPQELEAHRARGKP